MSGASFMNDGVLLSVIVPVYNGAATLGKCLASIYTSDCQAHEVIVVNDASTDNSRAVAQSYPCTLINLDRNRGVANARNVGAAAAQGTILVFLDSDVVIEPDTLAKFASVHKDANIKICTSQVYPTSLSTGFAPELIAATWHYIIRKVSVSPSSVSTMAFSIDRRVFNEIGRFNTRFGSAGGEEFEIGVPIKSHGYKIHFDGSIVVQHHYQRFWPRFKTVLRRSHVYGLIACQYRFGFDKDQGTMRELCNSVLALIGFSSLVLMLFDRHYLALFFLTLLLHIVIDAAFYRYLKRTKSVLFALRAVPVHFAWYFAAGVGAVRAVVTIVKNRLLPLLSIPRLFFAETPPYLIFFVTSACNARCKHCFSKAYPQADMSLEEIDTMSKSFNTIMYLTYSGGEPSLRSDIVAVTQCFYENNHVRFLNFITNGFETDRLIHSIEQILRLCPEMELMISFSLDGIGPLHDEIRNYPGGFDRLLASIGKAKHLRNYYKRLRICTITTYSNYNESSILAIIDFVHRELAVPGYLNHIRGEQVVSAADEPDLELYIKASAAAKANNARLQHQSSLFHAMYDLTAKLVAETKAKGTRVIPCQAGRKMIGIRSDGTVAPCEMLPFTFGKISQYGYDIKQVLRSGEASKYFEFLGQNQCHCTWECAMTNNIVYSWKTYPRLLVELMKNWLGLK